jgi:hypothetical protein
MNCWCSRFILCLGSQAEACTPTKKSGHRKGVPPKRLCARNIPGIILSCVLPYCLAAACPATEQEAA